MEWEIFPPIPFPGSGGEIPAEGELRILSRETELGRCPVRVLPESRYTWREVPALPCKSTGCLPYAASGFGVASGMVSTATLELVSMFGRWPLCHQITSALAM